MNFGSKLPNYGGKKLNLTLNQRRFQLKGL